MDEIVHYNYPVPFCIIKNFMTTDTCEQIKKELEGLVPYLQGPEKTGTAHDTVNFAAKRKGIFLHDHEHLRVNSGISSIFDKVVSPGVVNALTEKSWVYGYFRNSLFTESTLVSLYQEGDEYKYHRDSSAMSLIYYIFEGEFAGGDFFIENVKVPIENNSIIIFPSCAQHMVTPVKGSGKRWSITTFYNLWNVDVKKYPPPNIYRYRNFVNPDDWGYIQTKLKSGQWTLTGSSNGDPGASPFWNMDLNTDEFFTKYLFEKIPNGPWKLERVYANGHQNGQDGEFHQDSTKQTAWTFMLYATDVRIEMLDRYGGTTEFKLEKDTISQRPEPNLGILFKSDIVHKGNSPCRYTNDMRMTIAWKLSKA